MSRKQVAALVWGLWLLGIAGALVTQSLWVALAVAVALPLLALSFASVVVGRLDTALLGIRQALEGAERGSTAVLEKLDGLPPLPGEVQALRTDFHDYLNRLVATEAAMEASTAATRDILNSTRNAVFGVDADGNCLFANGRAHELLGALPGAMVGNAVHLMVHRRLGVDDDAHCPFCVAPRPGGAQNFYNQLLHAADGAYIDVDYYAFRLGDSAEAPSWVVTLTDISERRSIERRYESLVASLPVGVYTTNLDGELWFANERFCEMTGFALEELLGLRLAGVLDTEEGHVARELDDVVTRETSFAVEHEVRRKDGTRLWVLSRGDLERNRAGAPIGINGVYADISDLKAAQRELEALNATLETRIEEATRELTDTNAELVGSMARLEQAQDALVEREKMAALGGLMAGMSHEINTPIGVAKGAATHLKDTVEKVTAEGGDTGRELARLSAALQESADLVESNLNRAADLVRRFKRVSVDQSYGEPRVFDLRTNIEDAVANVARELARERIEVEIDCDPGVKVFADPGAYTQVHTIVLTNVRDHAFDDTDVEDRRVRISAAADGERVALLYQDNGRGVSEEVRRRIFEPFFTTRRHKGGTGLGMHILYLLVTRSLGGTIACEAGEDGGLALRLDLPVQVEAR